MKKIALLPLYVILISFASKATVHVVQVANFQFTPANVSDVTVGDTMRWVWVSGSHTTTDDPATQSQNTLPAGAPVWNASINAASPSFDYKVTVAGDYHYWCIPHSPNMAASFTASNTLPIKLILLDVSGSNGKAVVNWKTASEQNTDYFSVRRSLNGSSYTEIAKIFAAGNSNNEKSYSYVWEVPDNSQQTDQNLLYKELISQVKNLPPSYRIAFNMYVIDGFSHQEIAEKLGISVGTSKSNLAKARMQLKKFLDKDVQETDICSL